MKKALSLILVLVLCLSLCACSGTTDTLTSEEKTLVGEWKPTDPTFSDRTLVFFDSGKGKFVADKEGWGSDYHREPSRAPVFYINCA